MSALEALSYVRNTSSSFFISARSARKLVTSSPQTVNADLSLVYQSACRLSFCQYERWVQCQWAPWSVYSFDELIYVNVPGGTKPRQSDPFIELLHNHSIFRAKFISVQDKMYTFSQRHEYATFCNNGCYCLLCPIIA